MKKEIKSLQEDNRLLRVQKSAGVSQDFLVGPPRTVQVPPQFEHIFKKAESEVTNFQRGTGNITSPGRALLQSKSGRAKKCHDKYNARCMLFLSLYAHFTQRFIIMRGPAISLEFKNVIQNMLGDAKEKEALELARHILYDLAYVLCYIVRGFILLSKGIGRADCESFCSKMVITDPLVLLAAGTIQFSFRGFIFKLIFVNKS